VRCWLLSQSHSQNYVQTDGQWASLFRWWQLELFE
jgi:hypothetical protein